MRNTTFALLVALSPVGAQGVVPLGDEDGDGLTWAAEAAGGTDPARADSDGDGVPDGTEACAPGGGPRDPSITKAGHGVRLLVWRDQAQAWLLVVTRTGPVRRFAVNALWGPAPPVRLEMLLVSVAAGPDGTHTMALAFPASVLGALGGAVSFAVWAEDAQGMHYQHGTLMEQAGVWSFRESMGPGRARVLPAERGAAGPFPVPAQAPPETCWQTLENTGIPGMVWMLVLVTREECGPGGIVCVFDCGRMVGGRFPWRRDGRGQDLFPGPG